MIEIDLKKKYQGYMKPAKFEDANVLDTLLGRLVFWGDRELESWDNWKSEKRDPSIHVTRQYHILPYKYWVFMEDCILGGNSKSNNKITTYQINMKPTRFWRWKF